MPYSMISTAPSLSLPAPPADQRPQPQPLPSPPITEESLPPSPRDFCIFEERGLGYTSVQTAGPIFGAIVVDDDDIPPLSLENLNLAPGFNKRTYPTGPVDNTLAKGRNTPFKWLTGRRTADDYVERYKPNTWVAVAKEDEVKEDLMAIFGAGWEKYLPAKKEDSTVALAASKTALKGGGGGVGGGPVLPLPLPPVVEVDPNLRRSTRKRQQTEKALVEEPQQKKARKRS